MLAAAAMAASLMLVAIADFQLSDAVTRARFVVSGLEFIALALLVAYAVHACKSSR